MRSLGALILLIALLSSLGAQDKEQSTLQSWRETLRYGTDSEIQSALRAIRDAKERTLTGELAALLTGSRSDELRTSILSYLQELEDPSGADAVRALLASGEDNSPALLRAALSYAGSLKLDGAHDDVLALARSTDESVASAAVAALGKLGAAGSAADLLTLYDSEDTGQSLRNQIILALGELGDRSAVPLLMEIAGDRDAERVARMYASASLGKIADPAAVEVLTANLSENDALIRTYAAGALGRMRAPGVARLLTQVLRDANAQVRTEAARAVADGATAAEPDEELRLMLEYRARRDDTPLVRRESIRALGTLGGEASFQLLRSLYEDSRQSLDIRSACLLQLTGKDLHGSLESITRVIDSEWSAAAEKQKTLEATAAELAKAEAPELEPLYDRFLGSANISVRISGMRGAALNGMKQLGDKILQAAKDPIAGVRREALSALEKLGIPAPEAAPAK